MNESVMNISNSQLMLTYLFALIAMLITSFNGINRNKDIVVGTLRMTVQLFIAGFILVYIFDSASFILSALMVFVMEFFAIFNIVTNKKGKLNSGLKRTLILAQVIGTIFTLAFFLIIVVRPKPI